MVSRQLVGGESHSINNRNVSHEKTNIDVQMSDESDNAEGLSYVGCGTMHSVALTHAGLLYVWGSSGYGQLGLGKRKSDGETDGEVGLTAFTPTILKMPKQKTCVIQVAVGCEHCLAVTESDTFAWGRGLEGQLGTGTRRNAFTPETVKLKHVTAISCAAGEDHSAAIGKNGDGTFLFTWGRHSMGKLGLDDPAVDYVLEPTEVSKWGSSESTQKVLPKMVVCGTDHTVVLCSVPAEQASSDKGKASSDRGSIWTFGSGWCGRLGHGNTSNQPLPKEVEGLSSTSATMVACGSFHTCAIVPEFWDSTSDDASGKLWVWGKNKMICEADDVCSPRKFIQIDGTPDIQTVHCAHQHTFVITRHLDIYAWGDNQFQQLGLGKNYSTEVKQPEQMNLSGLGRVVTMGTGRTHTIVVSDNKDAYAWGERTCGRLGNEVVRSEKQPPELPVTVKSEWSSIQALIESMNTTAGHGKAEQLIEAIKEGQKVKSFSIMQMLLKQELGASKETNLRALEAEAISQLSYHVNEIYELPSRERRIDELEEAIKNSVRGNMRHFNLREPPKISRFGCDEVVSKLHVYEELLFVLQQQACYLASLSSYVPVKTPDAPIFDEIVGCIYKDLKNERVLYLFITMLKLMISAEIEQGKDVETAFDENTSRVVRIFKQLALSDLYFAQVVHPVMDISQPGSVMSSLGCLTQTTIFALSKEDYKKAVEKLNTEHETVWNVSEETVEFQASIEKFREFIQKVFLPNIRCIRLPDTLKLIFLHSIGQLNKRKHKKKDEKAEKPLLRLLLHGMLLPMFREHDKYGGAAVFIHRHTTGETSDHNFGVLAAYLKRVVDEEHTVDPKDRYGFGNKILTGTADLLKRELIKYIEEQTSKLVDETRMRLMIQSYVEHFDRTKKIVSVKVSKLMRFSNLLKQHESKFRISQHDAMESCLGRIKQWTLQDIEQAESTDQTMNFQMCSRFLLEETWGKCMMICQVSQCPVPPKLSGSWSSTTGVDTHDSGVAIRPYVSDNANQCLEQVFLEIEPIKAATFQQLQGELETLTANSTRQDAEAELDYEFSHRLADALAKVKDFARNETPPDDLLSSMAATVINRDKYRRSLTEMKTMMTAIEEAKKKHNALLQAAENKLKNALAQSRTLLIPKQFRDAGETNVSELIFVSTMKRIEKLKEFGREELAGCSFSPMRVVSLSALMQQRVIVGEPNIQAKPLDVLLTIVIANSGADVMVGVKREKIVHTVKRFHISEARLRELRRREKDATVLLPFDEEPFLFKCSASKLEKLISNLMMGRRDSLVTWAIDVVKGVAGITD
eukprot:TRINITY_DN33816_c0_g1_i1.p1 TRINITY_DN33816_c0_g1~~TRINITY_DN33816_c0_g1_i1.p1  ORF type:complete len:1306 (-),score=176.43 TRINITY_DN33816_c0_g1_i1:227-4144(-)